MSGKPLFSIVLIARNEAKRIRTFLKHLEPFLKMGGELMVVDSNSSDDTQTICRAHGALVCEVKETYRIVLKRQDLVRLSKLIGKKVTQRLKKEKLAYATQVVFDFSGAHNYGSAAASSDYVLHLDCGDLVTTLDVEAINARLTPGCLVSMTHYLNQKGDKHIVRRFFDRRHWQYHHRCHEFVDLVPKADPRQTSRIHIPEHILKVVYRREARAKPRPYIPSLFLDWEEDMLYFRSWYYLAREFFYLQEFSTCINLLEKALKKCTKAWTTEQSSALVFIGKSWIGLKQLDKANASFVRSLKYDASRRENWVELAYVAQVQGNFMLAKTYSYAALSLPHATTLFEPFCNYQDVPHKIIYNACINLSATKSVTCPFMREGFRHLTAALQAVPTSEAHQECQKTYFSEFSTASADGIDV